MPSQVVYTNNQYYQDIADSIRSKNGSSTTYRPSEMAAAIDALNVSGVITLQNKTVNPTTSQQEVSADNGYDGLDTVTVTAIQTEEKETTSNGDVVPSSGKYLTKVTVAVPSSINNQNKTVTPTESRQNIVADDGYSGLGLVTVNAISSEYVGSEVTRLSATTYTPTTTDQTISANTYLTGAQTIKGDSDLISSNIKQGVTIFGVLGTHQGGSTINNQDKTVTPSETEQSVEADSDYTGLGTVTVEAISSTYVGSGISRRSSTDLSASGKTVTVPAGYYSSQATKDVTTMTLPTSTSASATSGYTSKATVSRSTSDQYINIPTGYNTAGGYYKINAVANGTAGTPTATKGSVSNHSISVTPSVTNTTGYITGSTINGTAVTVSASELVSGKKEITSNGDNIDVTNYASVKVAISGDTPVIDSLTVTPTESEQTFNSSSVTGYKPVTVSAISSTYVGSGITQRDSTDLTASGATVSVPAGYYSSAASKAISTGSATNSGSASGTSATITTGTNTITLSKAVSITPSVTAGYVSSGTAGNVTVSLTGSVTVDPTPTASGKTVTTPAGYYTESTTTDVSTMTLPTSTSASATSGYASKATVSRSTSDQYINIPTGYNTAGAYYKISAVPDASLTFETITNSNSGVGATNNKLTLFASGLNIKTTSTSTPGYVNKSSTIGTADVYLFSDIPYYTSGNNPLTSNNLTVTAPTGYYSVQMSKTLTDGNLTAGNIKSGVTIFGVEGTYTGSGVSLQTKTATPTESSQEITPDSGYDGLSKVTVSAISSTYIGSGITQRDSTDLSASGATVSVPAGYYAEAASKSVTTMTLPTSATSSATSGYTSKATISRSTSDQYINIPAGYNSAGGYYKINAVANGSATGPSSLSGSSATISTGTGTITLTKTGVTTTPTVSAGYVSSATASTATVSLTASVDVNPTPTASGKTVTTPAGYYSTSTTTDVATMTLPTSVSSSATSGYASKATISRSTSDQYINIPTGYNTAGAYYKISAVANGSTTAPASISGTSATVSTGTNTITLTKTVSVTPTVSAGYISSGTAGNSSVSLTASVTTQGTRTITPTTTNQTISSGTYITGTQTISGDANLVAGNIKSGTSIFGVTGSYSGLDTSDANAAATDIVSGKTAYVDGRKIEGSLVIQKYYTGSSVPSSSLGNNGDIYFQS